MGASGTYGFDSATMMMGWGWRLWLRTRRPPDNPGEKEDKGPASPSPQDPRRPRSAFDELEPTLLSPSDIDLIARLVRAEAAGEPYDGQVAVAAVVLNRLKSPLFPNTVRSIIYQARQFETVSNGCINRPADEIHVQAVQDALSGKDPSKGALFFFNPAGTSSRFMHGLPVAVRIGGHVFSNRNA
ncbi:MAG: cell wall hydrolase [Bacillota bacterium]|nr:cell wall hydrolase [Bacillota bacterium]